MMHGYDWTDQDVSGWLAQEKLDGCRAYWDGDQLLTKSGRRYPHVPPGVLAELQGIGQALDCELWAGRAAGLEPARLAAQYGDWSHPLLKVWVFDLPLHHGTAYSRRAALERLRSPSAFVRFVHSWAVSDIGQAQRDLARVKSDGGEGLMLRDPAGLYRPGRRECLLKMKP